MIAALYVQRGGVYWDLPGVDPWDEARDARTYPGPWPVVAHPPCARWCALAPLNARLYGHEVGADGGCFLAALQAVSLWGGVLEHPAFSHAWDRFGLLRPQHGAWTRRLGDGGWVTQVSQACYGHPARKLTWLYAVACSPPRLDWRMPDAPGRIGPLHGQRDRVILNARVSWLCNHGNTPLRRIHKTEASRTPIEFRDLLLAIARSAKPRDAAPIAAQADAGDPGREARARTGGGSSAGSDAPGELRPASDTPRTADTPKPLGSERR